MFIVALSTVAIMWKQSKYQMTDEWTSLCGIYTQWITIAGVKKDESCSLLHYGYNLSKVKSEGRGQIPYDLTCGIERQENRLY